jgi:hypothetical protein
MGLLLDHSLCPCGSRSAPQSQVVLRVAVISRTTRFAVLTMVSQDYTSCLKLGITDGSCALQYGSSKKNGLLTISVTHFSFLVLLFSPWCTRDEEPKACHEYECRNNPAPVASIPNCPFAWEGRTHNGCRAIIPYRLASRPVTNGKAADPACPKPHIHPTPPRSAPRHRLASGYRVSTDQHYGLAASGVESSLRGS